MRLPFVFAVFFGQWRIEGEHLAAKGHHPRQQGARKISGVIGQGLPYLRIVGIGFQGLQIFLEGGLEKIVVHGLACRVLRGLLFQALRLFQMGVGGFPRARAVRSGFWSTCRRGDHGRTSLARSSLDSHFRY